MITRSSCHELSWESAEACLCWQAAEGACIYTLWMQAALAAGLLNLFGWKPRTVGFLGIVASAINCYTLFPPVPAISKAPALPGNSHKQSEITAEPKLELKKA